MPEANLKLRIQEEMKGALKAKATERLGTIRLLLAAVKQREIDERVLLKDEEILAVINKMIKQRKEAADQFEAANRLDLSEKERREIEVLIEYLPPQMNEKDIEAAVQAAIQETSAQGKQDMGKVMALLKSRIGGTADFTLVSSKVKELLN